jgi:hypothetical protein
MVPSTRRIGSGHSILTASLIPFVYVVVVIAIRVIISAVQQHYLDTNFYYDKSSDITSNIRPIHIFITDDLKETGLLQSNRKFYYSVLYF